MGPLQAVAEDFVDRRKNEAVLTNPPQGPNKVPKNDLSASGLSKGFVSSTITG